MSRHPITWAWRARLGQSMLLLGIVLLALAPGRAHAQGPVPLTVAAGELWNGDLASVDQPIVILGVVDGDVTSWSGSITILGQVHGDVVSYAGTIELGPQADVRGSVLALSGGVLRENAAQVAGRVLGDDPVVGGKMVASVAAIFGPAQQGTDNLPQPLVSGALALVALLLATACAVVWPRRTGGVSLALRRAPGRSVAVGALTTLLLGLLLVPLSGLLALSLVGLPLLLPLLLALHVPYLFGLAGLGRTLAERLRPGAHAVAATVVGVGLLLLPLALLGAIAPIWSSALFYLVAGVGLGATILSRGGAYALRTAR